MRWYPKALRNEKLFAICALGIMAVSALIGATSLHKLQTQYSVMQFLPENHPSIAMDASVRARFHLEDRPLFIGLISLGKSEVKNWYQKNLILQLEKLTQETKQMEGAAQVLSLATLDGAVEGEGNLSVGKVTQLVQPENWESHFSKDTLVTPNLISQDGRTALIYLQLKDANVENLVRSQETLRNLLKSHFPQLETSVGGVPAVQTDLGLLLNKELANFLALTLIACALTLLIIFRSLSTVWIPLILVAYCNLMVLAMLAWTGITFTILSSTIPIMVFIDVMTISCHILFRIHEEGNLRPVDGESRFQLILRTSRIILLPNILGSITTSVGFLTLLLSKVPLIHEYGKAVALCILLSSALTSLGIIPLLILFPAPIPREWVHKPARWALWILQYKKTFFFGTLALCGYFTFAGRQLDWTGRLFDDLPQQQEARVTTERIDQEMGGVIPLEILIDSADWTEPSNMLQLQKTVTLLRKVPGVGTVLSLPDFLQIGSRTEQKVTRASIAETMFFYSMAPGNPIEKYLTSDNKTVRVEVRLRDLPADESEKLLASLKNQVQAQFPESSIQFGGMGAIVHTIHDEISHELIFGFWQALVLIVGMLTFVFRSLLWAAVSALPNLVPPLVLLGYLGLTHTPIKPGVAIIFSIALGLAFTNTIYAFNRIRELRKPGGRLPVSKTFYLESNPCLVSTLVVMMGFSVFLFSYFELNRTFGACMLVSIVAGLVGDLVFLPSMLKYIPWILGSPKGSVDTQTDELAEIESQQSKAA